MNALATEAFDLVKTLTFLLYSNAYSYLCQIKTQLSHHVKQALTDGWTADLKTHCLHCGFFDDGGKKIINENDRN